MEETERRDAELVRCVAAMAAGDRAFIVTFAERFGGLVRELAVAAGAPTVDDELVADVAVEMFDRAAGTALGARDLVESVVAAVVSGPEGVAAVVSGPEGVADVVSGPEGVAGSPGASCVGDTTQETDPAGRGQTTPGAPAADNQLWFPEHHRRWTTPPALRAA